MNKILRVFAIMVLALLMLGTGVCSATFLAMQVRDISRGQGGGAGIVLIFAIPGLLIACFCGWGIVNQIKKWRADTRR